MAFWKTANSRPENDMDQSHHSARSNPKTGLPAAAYWFIAFLLAGILALSVYFYTNTKDDPPAKPEPTVVDGAFPMAEPELSNAIIRGDIAEIRKVIDGGGDVNIKDGLDRTPLHIAAFYGQPKVVELLLVGNADINAKDHVGMTPLHAAVISGGRQTVQMLLSKGADIGAQTEAGQTALHLSAATGQPKLTKFLIEQGSDLQKKDSEGRIPLYYAKKNYHPQTTAVIEQAMAKKAPPVPAAPQAPVQR